MLARPRRNALVSLVLVHAAAALAVGCSDAVSVPTPGDVPGLAPDAGADASPPPPVPPSDAGAIVDSGASVDAGLDAGAADAASAADASSSDAGPVSPPAPAGEPSPASCPAGAPSLLAESASNIWDMAMDDTRLYWTTNEGTLWDHGVLVSLPKAGGVAPTRMSETAYASYRGLDAAGGNVYFAYTTSPVQGPTDAVIASVSGSANGAAPSVLATKASGLVAPSEVRVVGGRVYFSDVGSGGSWTYGVRSIPIAGGAAQLEVDTTAANGATTMPYVDASGFWFGSFPSAGGLDVPGSVYHASFGTVAPSVVDATGPNTTPTAFAHDGTSLFWTEFVPNWQGNPGYPFVDNVGRLMVKTGSSPAYPLAVAQHGTGLALDPAKSTLYFAVSFTHGSGNPNVAIVKIAKGGGAVTPVVCGLGFYPRRLFVDGTHVYFADNPATGTNRVYRVAR